MTLIDNNLSLFFESIWKLIVFIVDQIVIQYKNKVKK